MLVATLIAAFKSPQLPPTCVDGGQTHSSCKLQRNLIKLFLFAYELYL